MYDDIIYVVVCIHMHMHIYQHQYRDRPRAGNFVLNHILQKLMSDYKAYTYIWTSVLVSRHEYLYLAKTFISPHLSTFYLYLHAFIPV
jgi:hypothetical protein